jgi:hypothetical protein
MAGTAIEDPTCTDRDGPGGGLEASTSSLERVTESNRHYQLIDSPPLAHFDVAVMSAKKCRHCRRSEVVRGGVEPPTFRFSEGFAGPGQSITVRFTRPYGTAITCGSRLNQAHPGLLLAER